MDKSKAASDAVRLINKAKENLELRPSMIEAVCSYFDFMKGKELSQADKLFMHYLANQAGIPQYYYPMLNVGSDVDNEVCLQTFSNYIHESSLMVGEDVMLHRYQKEILERFEKGKKNRYFLSAATSFGKTFLIYEIVRKMEYSNVVFIFPTISLLSENLFKIHMLSSYKWIKEDYAIHTLSDTEIIGEKNLFIFTPERFLSFLDKNQYVKLDFVFVDEVYKIDNDFIIDEVHQENDRDVAYRIALHELLKSEHTDALLSGPYIVYSPKKNTNDQSSFKAFLDWYNFIFIDYNRYDIVNKKEITVNTSLKIDVDDTFTLTFTDKSKKIRVIQLVMQLLNRGENSIIYCGQKYMTESWAKNFLAEDIGLKDIYNERVIRLTKHIDNLFDRNKGSDWIISKALKKGIGIHHGLVPKYIQQEIISLFNDNILKVLICTTTITEGVNTTAKNMIILSGKKGNKDLKKFDAQNIEGRAGRFMQHYKGRIFILDKKFLECIKEKGKPIKHKFFDINADKTHVDIVLTERAYLTNKQIEERDKLDKIRENGEMPKFCFDEFKTISYYDKICLYKKIMDFSKNDQEKIKKLIKNFVGQHKTYSPGLELICKSICPIIRNKRLLFYVSNGYKKRNNCYLVDMISAFVSKGFVGSANYYINKEENVDKGIRMAAEFVFNILRYQVVKYFGLFNLLYKQSEALRNNTSIDNISGIEALLLRLEYNADTQLGRRVSDIGASFNVVKYYDIKEKNPEDKDIIEYYYKQLDDFEKYNVSKINQII